MSGPRDEIEPRPAVVSDVWHECGNCGGRSPCEESDARDATIERLTRERDAAQVHRTIAVRERDIALRSNDALVARLTDALEARDRAVREYLAAREALDDARGSHAAVTVGGVLVADAEIRRRYGAVLDAIAAKDAARDALRKIVEGE